MQITDVVLGLAAGVGIDLSPDGKTAFYVEWSIGELSKVEVKTGMVSSVLRNLEYPEDVEVDWQTGEMFVSERTGAIVRVWPGGDKHEKIAQPGGAPQQLDLKKSGGKRFLYTVCYDSGRLVRIEVDTGTVTTIASGLGHPVGVVVDAGQQFAYVTEQDQRSLTEVDLNTGSAKPLYTGLTAPFFLAWNKTAKGIFCVQRDPANSLVRLDLGSPVTLTTIATGLAWRPSGVAPNADNDLIYICADRELEVISFNGYQKPKPAKPPFRVETITFNFDKSNAIALKHHETGSKVPVPEFVWASRNEPAAYVVRTKPHIKVVLKKLGAYSPGAYAIGATGILGGVRRKVVTPVFNASALSDPIDFELMWPLPWTVGKPDVTFDWYARKSPGPALTAQLGSTVHRIYVILDRPTQPWGSEKPWVAALELACGWAAGSTTVDEAAGMVTERYYNSGRVKYDDANGKTHYGYGPFMLSEMIERMNGGTGLLEKVNCTDSARTVSTLSNVLGCDLWQSLMSDTPTIDFGFDLNPILAVGYPPPNPWPLWDGFSYHEVAWKGGCTENDRVFDGCLMVDGDSDPRNPPYAWVLPKNMVFGDCATMNYRLRLSPPGSTGCDNCKPQPSTKQRIAIG